MNQSSADESLFDRVETRSLVALVLVSLLVVSAVVGVVGSSGIAAAQQGNGDDTITKSEFRRWVESVSGMNKGDAQESARKNPRMVEILGRAAQQNTDISLSGSRLTDTIEKRPKFVINRVRQASGDGPFPAPVGPTNNGTSGGSGSGSGNGSGGGGSNRSAGNSTGGNTSAGSGGGTSGGPTSNQSVNQVIADFKAQNLGYKRLSQENKSRVQETLLTLSQGNTSENQKNKLLTRLKTIFGGGGGAGGASNTNLQRQRRNIIKEHLGITETTNPLPNIDINIPSLLDLKLKSLGSTIMDSVAPMLTEVYRLIFNTPVPENSGWNQILGSPTNWPFATLYGQLMEQRLYPVMQQLLGLALIFLAGAVAIPQFRYRHRIVDLLINLVAGITLLFFAWPIVTFLHGIADQITMWILPNPSTIASSSENLVSMSGAPIAMYLFGSSGLFATLFVLGLEFGFRQVLLAYLLPYVFGPLLLIRFVSPWGRLRRYASMFLWQYVNVLTMTIFVAIIMRAVIAIKWNFRTSGFVAALVIIALFAVMIAIPVVSTWFFLQVPSMVNARVSAIGAGVKSRAKSRAKSGASSAKDHIGSRARSAVGMTATGGRAVRDRAREMVTASAASQSSSSSSGAATDTTATSSSSGVGDTTAGEIRNFYHEQNSGPMSAETVKNVYITHYTGDDQQVATDGGD